MPTTLEKPYMPTTTIKHITTGQLTSDFWREHNISPQQQFNITIEVVEDTKKDDDIYTVKNLREDLTEAFQNVRDHQAGKIDLPNYDDFVKELENEV